MIADGDRVCDHCHWTYGDISVALIVQLEVVEQRGLMGPEKQNICEKANLSWFSYANLHGPSHMPRILWIPPLHLTTFIKKLAAAQSDRGNGKGRERCQSKHVFLA